MMDLLAVDIEWKAARIEKYNRYYVDFYFNGVIVAETPRMIIEETKNYISAVILLFISNTHRNKFNQKKYNLIAENISSSAIVALNGVVEYYDLGFIIKKN